MQHTAVRTNVDYIFLAVEICSSIREIDRRIDELDCIISSNWCTETGRQEIINRVKQLMDTKKCLQETLNKVDSETGIKPNANKR